MKMGTPSTFPFHQTLKSDVTAVSRDFLNSPPCVLIDIMNGTRFRLHSLVIAIFNTHHWNMCAGMIEDINAFKRKCS